jgi:predicted transcriptional regulator
MSITISPELEGRIQRVVASGRYATPELAMEAAVRQLEIDDPLASWSKEDLNAAIEEGLWSLQNEPLVTPEEARAGLAQLRTELQRG